jgi:ankyrin repeat protein
MLRRWLSGVEASDTAEELRTQSATGNLCEVQGLLKAGADLSAPRRGDGETALHIAASMGHVGVVAALLRSPVVEATAPASEGWTPLHLAIRVGGPCTVCLLQLGNAQVC